MPVHQFRRTILILALSPAAAFAFPLDRDRLAPFEGLEVREITLSGNGVTRDYVIYRELDIQVGRPLSLDMLQTDLIHLENLDLFSSVDVVPSSMTGGVGIMLEVVELPSIIPYPAIKFTEQDGWSFGLGATSLNLTGRDITTSVTVLVGGLNTFQFKFMWPWISGNRRSIEWRAVYLERFDQLNEFEETSYEFTPWVGTWVRRDGRLRAGGSWFRMQSGRDGITLEPDNSDDFFSAAFEAGCDRRDSFRFPRRGTWSTIELGRFTGSGKWWSVILDFRQFFPIRQNTISFGALVSFRSGTALVDVPQYLFYRMGGANTIRGYDVEVLGRELFGKSEMIYTAEYEVNIIPIQEVQFWNWGVNVGLSLAAFVDAGTAWSTRDELTRERFKIGGGAGLRFLVPGTEMIRLDLAIGDRGVLFVHLASRRKLEAQRERIR